MLFVWFVKYTAAVLFYPFFKQRWTKEYKKKKLPKPAILVCNHPSNTDSVLLTYIFRTRRLIFSADPKVLSGGSLATWFVKKMGIVVVDRKRPGVKAINDMMKVVNNGEILTVYAEGRISHNGELLPFKPGAATVSMLTGVPVVPFYTDGNYGFFKRIGLAMGDPIYPKHNPHATTEEIEEFNKKIFEAIKKMKEATDAR
ncbi:MAG: 1-acyl-sn-glycerol-3-phosphate acyltransferase [Ruminococcaceae bacterium]|nr:1-acyl-sn-glycerol-3-phosphate acyltransferase [Oscillospiraceae bacterium]